jgi:hypothetical protein
MVSLPKATFFAVMTGELKKKLKTIVQIQIVSLPSPSKKLVYG